MTAIAIMQGRLSPPVNGAIQAFPVGTWEAELPRAAEAGIAAIEWIWDAGSDEANPLATDAGVARLRSLQVEHDVAVRTLCADWFMPHPLVRDPAAPEALARLLGRCGAAGIRRCVLPFVDASSLEGAREEDLLVRLLAAVDAAGVALDLETDLPPGRFAALLERLPPHVTVNYDTGNSASLGFDVDEELDAYGVRIGHVHVKDRVRGGGTVPLGEGDADLPRAFRRLRALGYDGDLVLQVARAADGDEVAWAAANRRAVERLWEEAA